MPSPLTAWRNATFGDANSLFVNPLFVDIDGADNVLGYVSFAADGRDDDFHEQSLYGTFKGGALAPVRGAGGTPFFLTPALREQYRQVWARGLEPALNYYRASPLRPPTGPGDHALQDLVLPDSVLRVAVPTTVLWGEQDHALRPGLLDGLQAWVPDLTVHRHAQASHWVVHEQHDWVVAQLQQALRQTA